MTNVLNVTPIMVKHKLYSDSKRLLEKCIYKINTYISPLMIKAYTT